MEYFAGANTRYGFKSLFDECFEKIQRVFILKGSSGCGKSTFMRRVVGKAEQLNLETDIIRCSADPDSLDGVIVKELGVAVVDGTAPHLMDVKYPCVRENIINLGSFWDENKLLPRKEEIVSLTNKKSEYYKNGYKCLSASGTIEDLKKQLVLKTVKTKKLDDAAFSIAKTAFGEKGSETKVFSTAFTANGIKTLTTFGKVKKLYKINGYASSCLLNALYGFARERGIKMFTSLSYLEPEIPDSIYFDSTETLVTILENSPCVFAEDETNISCSRFSDTDLLSSVRVRIKGLDRIGKEILDEAKTEFFNAKTIHSDIESIYITAMDFKLLDEFTFGFIKKLFGE